MISTILLIIIYIAFISLGLPDSILGAAWPVMHQDLNVPLSYAGILSMICSFGTIISSLGFSIISKKLRTNIIAGISTFLTAISLFLYGTLGNFYALMPIALILGLGAGSIDAALNNYVALHYKAKQMGFLHASWGIGTTVGPFLLAYAFANNLSWKSSYLIIAVIQSVIALLLLVSSPIWRKNNIKEEIADEEKANLGYKEALRKKGAIFALTAFFGYCAMEASTSLWASAYAVSRGAGEASAASIAGFLFWGLTIGRIITGFVADKLGDKFLIRSGLVISFISIVAIFILPLKLLGIALLLLGIGYGPLYPSMIHQTPVLYGRNASATLIGLQMASAYVGTTLMPSLFGLISNWVGIGIFPFYIAIFLLITTLSTELKRGGKK